MNYIKKIFEKKTDETVHQKLVRYGKGEYETAFMQITKGKNLKIKTSFEFTNDFFGIIAENIKSKAEVKGNISIGRDFENEMKIEVANYKKTKQMHMAEIETELKPEEMKEIYEKFKDGIILLNVKSENYNLSTGKKLPKPGGKVKEDFCKATLPLEFLEEFIWEEKNFKNAIIKHVFKVNDLIVPKEYENDYAQARVMAKRKGKLKRIIELDGRVVEKEVEFEA